MRLLLALALALTAWAQPTAPGTPQMLAKMPSGDLRLSPIVGLLWNADFDVWTIPVGGAPTLKAGVGIILTSQPGQPTEISVDPAQFVLLVPPPSGPGECTVSVPASNIVVMAQGPGFMFSCDPDPSRPGKRRWMATPKFATW